MKLIDYLYYPRVLLLALFCNLGYLSVVQAQHPFFYNIGTEQDLPSNEVYQIKQDSFGYIWIGCDAGLFRYDGFRFKQYSNSQMAGRSISDLQFDPSGVLWCKNFNGQILKVSGDSLMIAIDYSKKCGAPSFYSFTPDGRVWACCRHLISVYDKKLQLVKEIDLSATALHSTYDLSEIAYFAGKIYCARTLQGVFSIDPKTYKVQALPTAANVDYLTANFRALFLVDKQFCYLVLELPIKGQRRNKVHLIRNDSIVYVQEFASGAQNHVLYKLKSDQAGKVWLCTSNGVKPLQSSNQTDSMSNPGGILAEQRISDMLQDREGNYWFTSLQNGIYIIPSLNVLRYSSENSPDLKSQQLTRLHSSPNQSLWLGAYNGKVMHFFPKTRKIVSEYDQLHLPHRAVKNFFEDEDYFIISRNRNSVLLKKHHNDSSLVTVGDARALYIQNDTIFAVLSSKFLKAYSAKKHLDGKQKLDTIETISDIGGWSIAYDSLSQALWVTLSSGVHCYRNGQMTPILFDGQPLYGGFVDYSHGILWVSGLNSGVFGFVRGALKYHFSTDNGLRNNSTKAIEATGKYVWVSAASFLHRIRFADGRVDVFSKNLGIYAKDIEDIEVLNDTVYLATHKGLIQFPVEMVAENPIAPNIAITHLSLSDSILTLSPAIKLPYRHGQLRIYFTATAFRSQGNFRYEYRLIGLDSTWTTLSANNNFVAFTAIPPGHYRFEVRAVNESGLSSPIVATLNIHVNTPIWQRWWFFLLLSLVFVGLVVMVYNVRMGIVTRRINLEKQLTNSQLTALKAQMNPHFMYNALNSIQELMLTNDIWNANLYLNKFSTLMRRILKASDHDEILLEEEIAILQLYLDLEKLRFGDDFSSKIEMSESLKPQATYIASMIIQPFIENAIKHGLLHKKGEKWVHVAFCENSEQILLCTITDNGVGRKRAAEIKERGKMPHQSFATKATERRLEILNRSFKMAKIGLEIQDLYDETGEIALGTKVILQIPFHLHHDS